jgi:putative pyruvate formate lyase activating enzyme
MREACNLCPRHCNLDRSIKNGVCNAPDYLKIGAILIHKGEEPPLVQGSGSGAIFFSGCPLKCAYCQNREISQNNFGIRMEAHNLARYMIQLQEMGCSNINLVSPTHYTPQIFESLSKAKDMGLNLPIMVNSSGYEDINTISKWYEQANLYLMDLRYGDNQTGNILSKTPDYWDRAREVIRHIWEHIGPLEIDKHGRATKGIIVRHLLLPCMLSNPFSVLEFLAELSLRIPLSIMAQYNPAFYQGEVEAMKRPISKNEYQVVIDKALDLGFETIYTQDLASPITYSPDFHAAKPFNDQLNLLALT